MAGELIVQASGASGLGHLLERSDDVASILAVVAVIAVIGVAVEYLIVGAVDRRIRAKRGLLDAGLSLRRRRRSRGRTARSRRRCRAPASAHGSSSISGVCSSFGHDPADLELQPVGVPAVERLRRAVVGGAGERARLLELRRDLPEVAERLDLPGDVVQPDRRAPGLRRPGAVADREQAEVVVVVGVGRLEELRPRHLHHDPEPEHVAVELVGLLRVPHVQDGVVHPLDRHQSIGPRPSFSRPIFIR